MTTSDKAKQRTASSVNVHIYPYSDYSKSARDLARGLDTKRIRRENSKYVGGRGKTVINWGSASLPSSVTASRVLNNPLSVNLVSNKLHFFGAVQKGSSEGSAVPRIPEWTDSFEEAMSWAETEEVVCRRQLRGSGAAGLSFWSDRSLSAEELLEVPLFTKYKKKKEEYRVHVLAGQVLDLQKKVLRQTDDNGQPIDKSLVDFRVRNHHNGFIFARNDIEAPGDVIDQAVLAVSFFGLDFGAVDVIWNEHERKAYVLEINTAPGLEGTTLENYISGFKSFLAGG